MKKILVLAVLFSVLSVSHPLQAQVRQRLSALECLRIWRLNREIEKEEKDWEAGSACNFSLGLDIPFCPEEETEKEILSAQLFEHILPFWGDIDDQGSCGSCWIMAILKAATIDVYQQYREEMYFSPQEPLSCDPNNHQCCGGKIPWALSRLKGRRLVLSDEFPFDMAGSCKEGTLDCLYNILHPEINFRILDYRSLLPEGSPSWAIADSKSIIDAIDIEKKGVITGFYCYSDFSRYKRGVYERTSLSYYAGGHATVIIGYGFDRKGLYWICVNSWGPDFGQLGIFRIRAKNCRIGMWAHVITTVKK